MEFKLLENFSILYVEDDDILLFEAEAAIGKYFRDFDTAKDGMIALQNYRSKKYDMVISDITMPNLNGVELVREIKNINQKQKVIITSSSEDSRHIIDLINIGVNKFIPKPLNYKQLLEYLIDVAKSLENERKIIEYQHILEDKNQELEQTNKELDSYKNTLEERVESAIKHIKELNIEIENTQKEVIFTMGAIGESRSKETGNHVKRVAEYSKVLAQAYGLNEQQCELLKYASPMHDIGKVAIPDAVLNKPGLFTPDERTVMETHAELGYNMLKHSNREILKTAAIVAYEHHERWDGLGYPRKIGGEEIHIYGRITAVADVFDALGSDRCYKKAWELERILELFKSEQGRQFDPSLVKLLLDELPIFLEIRDRFRDD